MLRFQRFGNPQYRLACRKRNPLYPIFTPHRLFSFESSLADRTGQAQRAGSAEKCAASLERQSLVPQGTIYHARDVLRGRIIKRPYRQTCIWDTNLRWRRIRRVLIILLAIYSRHVSKTIPFLLTGGALQARSISKRKAGLLSGNIFRPDVKRSRQYMDKNKGWSILACLLRFNNARITLIRVTLICVEYFKGIKRVATPAFMLHFCSTLWWQNRFANSSKVKKLGRVKITIIHIPVRLNGYSTEERAHFGRWEQRVYRGAKSCLFEGGIRVLH